MIAGEGWLKGTPAAAKYADVSERLIFTWIDQGILKPTKASARLLFFRPSDIDEAIERLAENHAGEASA